MSIFCEYTGASAVVVSMRVSSMFALSVSRLGLHLV